ncbi:amino acid permease [Weissella muntiaci]|uniref:Amino acid permease n=1 Tax=Weissella muntiaci TaxID=2508881 RepID=A0A6C2C1U8_9LACO|nr:basic amino acid/polyamine antiporter [Weissella muntiaci]TYC47981.1 amino acid permease [Weissella muntiaci]
MDTENKNGIGLLSLVALIVSGAIGGGVFNLSNDLATGATPGGVIVSWLFIGFGILMLVLSLNHLVVNKPELSGVSDYARAGFGDFVGFLSGWGYWLSAWAGNIAFAVLMMTSFNYFFPGIFANANGSLTLFAVIFVSIISWLLTILVVQGVESAALINTIVLIAKLIPLVVFMITGIVLFKAGVFDAHFWQNFVSNVNADGVIKSMSFTSMTSGDVFKQVQNSLMVMIWVFVGIEGAAMMGDRAKRKSDAGKATILGLISLLFIYVLLSLLPFGFLSQQELANMNQPGLVYIMKSMVGGWGGSLMAIGLIISLLGAWLSWTMLPVEATSQLADQKLLPKWFGALNKNNAPANSLWLTQIFVQIFIIITYFVANAYNVFVYLCTAAIMICYALVGAYMMKVGMEEKSAKRAIIGFFAVAFQVVALWLSGWQFVWMASILYMIGIVLYFRAKKENNRTIGQGEWIMIAFVTILALGALYGLIANQFGLRALLGL